MVCLAKFILDKIKEKIAEKAESVVWTAKAQAFMTIDKQYKLYFYGIDGLIGGEPSKNERLAFYAAWNAIDTQYNSDARKKCEVIWKKDKPDAEDIKFLKEEVRPYFEHSFHSQTGRLASMLGGIDVKEAEEANNIFKQNKKASEGIYK